MSAGVRGTALVALVLAATPAAALELTKTLAAGQSPNPAPGDAVVFTITLHNDSTVPVTGHTLDDFLDPCFDPIASCSQVACSGGVSCGTCATGAGGFQQTAMALAPVGQPGDTLVLTVTTAAGSTPGACSNTAQTSNPSTGGDLVSTATVTISSLAVTKSLDAGQSPTPRPGAPVVFVITVKNNAPAAVSGLSLQDIQDPCLEPITDCSQVTCTGGAACGTCSLTADGFVISGFALDARGQPGDTIRFRIATAAGPAPGPCANTVLAPDPDTGADLRSSASVVIGAMLSLDKALDAGQSQNPAPGEPVVFVITLRNESAGPITGGVLDDILDPCFEPLASCSQVSCGAGPACGTCQITPTGFTSTGYSLAPAGQPGDTLIWRVQATAGPVPGACSNAARTSDPGTGSDLDERASVVIGAALSISKTLESGQNPTPAPGQPVRFVITIANRSASPVSNITLVDDLDPCFERLVSCAAVACGAGPACGTCAITPGGFDVTGISLAAAGQPGDSISFQATAVAGGAPGVCNNTARTTDALSGADLSSTAGVEIVVPAGLAIAKSLGPGQPDPVTDGDPVVFEIRIQNTASPPAPLTGITLTDTLDSRDCILAPGNCSQISCSPAGPDCGTCSLVPPRGFQFTGINLAPAGQPGDTLVYTVSLVAANVATVVSCRNDAATANPAVAATPATITVNPPGSQACDLRKESLPALTPPLNKTALFADTTSCVTPVLDAMPPTLAVGGFTALGSADTDPVPTGDPIFVYKVLCPCAGTLYAVKRAGLAHLQWN